MVTFGRDRLSSLRMNTITIMRQLFCNAKKIGQDQYGNTYFEQPQKKQKPKRWVMYNGIPEGSCVPPEWHGWLHYMFDAPPAESIRAPYDWQKSHLPNLTGTKMAFSPQSENNNIRKPYTPWRPEN